MAMTREEAYRILELHRDAAPEEIRASYKRLALRWHPDKHNNSPEATKKFQEISSAYKRLTSTESNDEIHLSRADMFDIFAHVFFHHRNGMFDFKRYNPYESDEDYSDDDDDDDMEDELLHNIATRLRNKYDRSKPTNYSKTNGKPAHNLSEAEALKNAEELIKEEERDRKKAEKRRQKKKRSKEKKRQKDKEKKDQSEKENKKENDKEKATNIQFEKLNLRENQNSNKPPQNVKSKMNPSSTTPGVKERSQNNSNKKDPQRGKGSKKNHGNADTESEEDEPDWDQSSAFFARAAGRNPTSNPNNSATNTLKDSSKTNNPSMSNNTDTQSNKNNNEKEAASEQLDPVILQSRQLAVRGNEMANLGNYTAAIELFTQAIKLDARDFRFFGNRSFCFDRLGQYEKALQDADVSISLAPEWPKGYFRRGRALAGLKLFSDSEVAFAQVLKLDKHCEDAMFELARVRVQQLEDMGFPTTQSQAAIRTYGTVQAALEALLAGKVQCPSAEEIYVSDGEEEELRIRATSSIAPVDHNVGLCKSVWVGNVNAEVVTDAQLQQIFSQCGKIESVKVLPTRYCAFINYMTPEAAARAIAVLQGYELGGQSLLLRYPNNSGVPMPLQPQANESFSKPKLTGPVNGDECYFWRTTGCSFGDRCRNRHLPESKGVDLKKVEAKYGKL